MSFLDNLTSKVPFLNRQENKEYFFALNIGPQKLKTCIWILEGDHFQVQNPVSQDYNSSQELLEVADQLLDKALGDLGIEPEKILFGVPDSWLQDDDLKAEYLKTLRDLVKALEIKPLAYVATSHALTHFVERKDGAPVTAILVGIDEKSIALSVSRAGKVDGTKFLKREDNLGQDIEKALLTFSDIEVLPSRILIYGNPSSLSKQKVELASFPWMSKLQFLHLPKIEILENDIDIKAVAFAGAVELNPDVKYIPVKEEPKDLVSPLPPAEDDGVKDMEDLADEGEVADKEGSNLEEIDEKTAKELGFVTGDVTQTQDEQPSKPEETEQPEEEVSGQSTAVDSSLVKREEKLPLDEYEGGILPSQQPSGLPALRIPNIPKKRLLIPAVIFVLLIIAYIFIPRATVTVYVEPRVLENDTEVTADPNIKEVDEGLKKIPGIYVETQVSGSEKIAATGKKEIGDPAKGTAVIYNKTNSSKTFSKGTTLTSQNGLKFTLEEEIKIASQSASEEGIAFGKANGNVVAAQIGADSNLPSGTTFTIANISNSEASAKAEGNFSGGTSKDVTVVTDADQKKLLATLASNLRKQASEQIQSKMQEGEGGSQKILEEALSEEIVKKSYSKNIGDQASEFLLNLTVNYKGLGYSEDDLKMIVSKLVETNVPEGFELNLAETETSADVSKVEKDKLTFLARFKAKLIPKIDKAKVKKQIVGKDLPQVAEILKSYENVLGSDIKISPPLPGALARIPFLESSIKVEVSLK